MQCSEGYGFISIYWYLLFSKCERISFIISVKVTFHTKLKIVSVHKGCRHDILLFSEAAFEKPFLSPSFYHKLFHQI